MKPTQSAGHVRAQTPEKNGDTCGHRLQEVALLQGLTEHVALLFNV